MSAPTVSSSMLTAGGEAKNMPACLAMISTPSAKRIMSRHTTSHPGLFTHEPPIC